MFRKAGMLITDKVWYGTGLLPALARTGLFPLEMVYSGVTSLRGKLYDSGKIPSHEPALPCISIGNLTVGGSGKTPIAAWFATQLAQRGAHPAIVMRGYGSDELLVHEKLNPGIPVVADPDRIKGVREAVAQGADIVVLDDAFQHRAVARIEDIVLVNADRWNPKISRQHLIPAGPWREDLSALRRASLAVITTKLADPIQISAVESAISMAAPALKVAVVYLVPDELVSVAGDENMQMGYVEGKRIFVVTSIADPLSFHGQLADAGAHVTAWGFPDHFSFSENDTKAIAAEARKYDMAVCTLKDAVKLGPLWPALAPKLWYVKQRVEVESGREHLAAILGKLTDRKLKLL